MRILLMYFLLIFSALSFGQTVQFNYGGQVTNYDSGKKEGGVKVSVVGMGGTIVSSTTASNGKYALKFDVSATSKFDIVFSKEGFVPKKVSFDFSGINTANIKEGEKLNPLEDLSLELFSVKPGIDFSFLEKEPVAKFTTDSKTNNLQADVAGNQRMKQKIDALLDQSAKPADNTDIKYNEAIAKGDALFKENKLEESMKQYEAAAFLKPKEYYPQKKIIEIEGLLKAKKTESYAISEKDQQYNNLIKAADNFRDNKQYNDALAKYRAASRVKNDEQYPKDEVARIEKTINELAAVERKEKEYQEAMTAGEAAMKTKQYEMAVKNYKAASDLKPNEKLPKDQLALAQKELKILSDAKQNQEKYDAVVKEAGLLFTQSKFEEAKAKYMEASVLKSTEVLPKERIKQCDEQLAKMDQAKKTEIEINALFEQGQKEIDKKDYSLAKATYKKILVLDPKKNLAQIKLDEIDRLIKGDDEAKNAESRFASYVKLADNAVMVEDFALAKQNYGAALDIKQDKVVQDKFNAVVAKMANLEAKMLVQNKYDEAMAEAKKLLDADELEKARAKFQNAASIDPLQKEPKIRLDEIDARLNKKSTEDVKYRALLDKGDQLVIQEKYLEAIKEFDRASEMRPAEAEPKQKSENAASLARESKDNDNRQFERILSAARSNIDSTNYDKARDLVNRAITNRPANKRPTDTRPEDMLKEINKLESAQRNYDNYLAEAQKTEAERDLKKAIDLYRKAGIEKPKEEFPPQKIKSLSEELNNQLGEAEKEKKFQENFKKGVSEVNVKTYELALESFQKAQSFKPDNQVVKDKISEVKQLIEDNSKAQASDKEKRIMVDALIREANILFEKRDWGQAKMKYTAVVELDSGQPFSAARIVECDAQLQAEKGLAEDTKYKALISQADNNFEKKDFLSSKDYFEQANTLRPTESYPIKKLAEIDRMLNPVILSSSALEPLGDVYTGEDSDLDLAKADRDRKNKKSEEFLKTKNESIAQMEEQNYKAQAKSYIAQKSLNSMETKTDDIRLAAEARAQDNVEQVKTIQYASNTKTEANIQYDNAQNLLAQEKLNYVRRDMDGQAAIEQTEVAKKAAQLKDQTSSMAQSDYDRSLKYSTDNVNKAKYMSLVSIEAQETVNDDASRLKTEEQLKIAKQNASDELYALSDGNTAKVVQNEERFRDIVAKNDLKAEDFTIKLKESNEQIKGIEMKNLENANEAYNREMEKYLTTKDVLNSQVKVSERYAEEENDRIRKEQARITKIKNTAEQELGDKVQSARDINIHNQSKLDYMSIQNLERNLEDEKVYTENAEVLKRVRNSEADVNAKLTENKQFSNYSTQESLTTVKAKAEKEAVESTEKQMKNARAVSDMYVVEEFKKENLAQKALRNQQETTEALGKVDTKVDVIKAHNTLGMDYQEGVTEEKFSQSGVDGTIHTIITRRVVVIDGHGDVYIRTQRDGVSTYKKNDKSINEYTWQKETQGSNLVRH